MRKSFDGDIGAVYASLIVLGIIGASAAIVYYLVKVSH